VKCFSKFSLERFKYLFKKILSYHPNLSLECSFSCCSNLEKRHFSHESQEIFFFLIFYIFSWQINSKEKKIVEKIKLNIFHNFFSLIISCWKLICFPQEFFLTQKFIFHLNFQFKKTLMEINLYFFYSFFFHF
jgi:hypothetical protein